MSTAEHYRSNLRDTLFNLFEFLEIQATTLGRGPFTALDEGATRESLRSLEELARTRLAPSFAEADRVPLALDREGNVTLPPALKRSLSAFFESGFHRLEQPEHLGGYGAPPTVWAAGFEFIAGAHASLGFYLFGGIAARVIDRLGTEAQRRLFPPLMIDRPWGATMVLTEPDAGSDVGAGTTSAKKVGDEWHLAGVKRFITNGDFDAVENIVHLVLARPEGAPGGTKGLSLFIVPKFWVNPDGTLGERNGVYCTNLEKKMGIKASATCEMAFGDGRPARGLLLGEAHDGIRQMFHVIEQARMGVGLKSMATLSTAYRNALAYANERVQGPDLLRAADKASPRVPIVRHPDVRRMLMAQKAHAEGMRALCLFTAHVQDRVELEGGHGADAARADDLLNDLLLPLVKGYCSEKAYELLALSLQCYGGSGYCQDYPIEQYVRDQKIDSLYEGTTHIQSLDLIFRKIARDGGATLRGLLGRVQATLDAQEGGDELAGERAALGRALGEVRGMFMALMGKLGESLYHAGFQGNRVLLALAELVVGWLLVRHAARAIERRAARPEDRAFYDGKVASARYFCKNVLPGLALARELVEASDLDLMELPVEAFLGAWPGPERPARASAGAGFCVS
ncbi:MAG TPA: acyl-CoA dehydrogenase [Polyangiaceae bacterium]|nr:acyl-CoA dehydrogenase [Polyangiaceae bacterium]